MADVVMRRTQETAIDWANLVAGVVLAATPWLFGYAGAAAPQWNALIVGVVIALVAIGALVSFRQWEEWVNLVLGLWVIISPWVLGFSGMRNAMVSHVVLGIIIAVLAAVELWLANQRASARM